MPKITDFNMTSETKWITMVAFRENIKSKWNLAIYVNGIDPEFFSCYDSRACEYTQEQALHYIKTFEQTMKAEHRHFIEQKMDKALSLLE